jgi:peptidyl-prolyl cis-trans isomerase C
MKNGMTYTAGAVALLLVTACGQKTDDKTADGKPIASANVAVINGKPLSRNTFNHYVLGVTKKKAEELTAEQRGELLDNLIRGAVVAAEAERSGLANKDETRAVLELQRLTILHQAAYETYLKDRKTSDEELRAEYGLQVAQMPKTQYRISHILLPTEAAAKEALTRLAAGASFAQLARQSLDSNSRDRGGDTDWSGVEAMEPAFAQAVMALQKGQTAPAPVQTQFGWHVIRVTDTRPTTPPTFESVRDRLAQIVDSKKFKAHTEELLAKAKITKTP